MVWTESYKWQLLPQPGPMDMYITPPVPSTFVATAQRFPTRSTRLVGHHDLHRLPSESSRDRNQEQNCIRVLFDTRADTGNYSVVAKWPDG
jgi:hypothetical protein